MNGTFLTASFWDRYNVWKSDEGSFPFVQFEDMIKAVKGSLI